MSLNYTCYSELDCLRSIIRLLQRPAQPNPVSVSDVGPTTLLTLILFLFIFVLVYVRVKKLIVYQRLIDADGQIE